MLHLKTVYKQKNSYGCGMYAVANACNLKTFVTPERLEISKGVGNLTGMLDRWMQSDGLTFYMQALYYDAKSDKIPSSYTEFSISGEILAMPLVFCVLLSEKGLSHMIGCHLDKLGSLYVYDSLKKDVFETTIIGLNDHYHSVFGMYGFCDIHTGEYAFIS